MTTLKSSCFHKPKLFSKQLPPSQKLKHLPNPTKRFLLPPQSSNISFPPTGSANLRKASSSKVRCTAAINSKRGALGRTRCPETAPRDLPTTSAFGWFLPQAAAKLMEKPRFSPPKTWFLSNKNNGFWMVNRVP